MSIPNSAKTAALLLGTGLTAAGLSLSVLGISSGESSSTESAEVAADPVLVATVSDVSLQTEEEGRQQAQAEPTVATPPVSDNEDEPTDEAPTTTYAPVPNTQPSTTPTLQEPSTTTSTTVAPTNPLATAAPATEYLTYQWEGIADIIVALHDGRDLEFWSAIPAPGWVFLVEDDTSTKVKIKFRPLNGGDEAEWQLSSRHGELKLKQER